MFKDFDTIDFVLTFLSVCLGISMIIFCYSFYHNNDEKECVDYYLSNGYILNSCKKYEKKLEILGGN